MTLAQAGAYLGAIERRRRQDLANTAQALRAAQATDKSFAEWMRLVSGG